jgi:hypothetical protein
MLRRSPPRKVTYFEPVPPRLARNTVIVSTFGVGHRFRCTMRVDCGQLDPGAVIRPVPGEWHPRMPDRLDDAGNRRRPLSCCDQLTDPEGLLFRTIGRQNGRSIGEFFAGWRAADDADRCRRTGRARRDPEAVGAAALPISPMPERAHAATPPSGRGSPGNRRRRARGSAARAAARRFARGSRQNRRRRAVGSCFLRSTVS